MPRGFHGLTRLVLLAGFSLAGFGCGREPRSLTAPAPPPAETPNPSLLPPEFQPAALELLAAAAAEPPVPLNDAEAAQLLRDNNLSWRVGGLVDRTTYQVLNALKAARLTTGTVWASGTLHRASDGVGFTFQPGDPRERALVVRSDAGPDLRVELQSVDLAWVEDWIQFPGPFGPITSRLPGSLVARVQVAGRLDARLNARFVPSSAGNYEPPRATRELSGWILDATDGVARFVALTEGESTFYFHGGGSQERVTALVTAGTRRILLSEQTDTWDYFDPGQMRGNASETQRGFRFERIGPRVMTLGNLDLSRFYTTTTLYRMVSAPDSWRAEGDFMLAGQGLAQVRFDAAPVDKAVGGPGLALARPGLAALNARDLPASGRLDALVPDHFPSGWYHGRWMF